MFYTEAQLYNQRLNRLDRAAICRMWNHRMGNSYIRHLIRRSIRDIRNRSMHIA